MSDARARSGLAGPEHPGEGMETLRDAIRRLERAGYRDSLRARSDGLLAVKADRVFAPEMLEVDEVVRFEGASDPGDQAVIFAVHSRDGALRGTFVTTYGAQTDPDSAEMMRRLEAGR